MYIHYNIRIGTPWTRTWPTSSEPAAPLTPGLIIIVVIVIIIIIIIMITILIIMLILIITIIEAENDSSRRGSPTRVGTGRQSPWGCAKDDTPSPPTKSFPTKSP